MHCGRPSRSRWQERSVAQIRFGICGSVQAWCMRIRIRGGWVAGSRCIGSRRDARIGLPGEQWFATWRRGRLTRRRNDWRLQFGGVCGGRFARCCGAGRRRRRVERMAWRFDQSRRRVGCFGWLVFVVVFVLAGNFNGQARPIDARCGRCRAAVATSEIDRADEGNDEANGNHLAMRLQPVATLAVHLLLPSFGTLAAERSGRRFINRCRCSWCWRRFHFGCW